MQQFETHIEPYSTQHVWDIVTDALVLFFGGLLWTHVLVSGVVVRVDEAVTEKELGHGVGLEGHVEGGARLLALKQVRVVTHLQVHTVSVRSRKIKWHRAPIHLLLPKRDSHS